MSDLGNMSRRFLSIAWILSLCACAAVAPGGTESGATNGSGVTGAAATASTAIGSKGSAEGDAGDAAGDGGGNGGSGVIDARMQGADVAFAQKPLPGGF